LELSMSSKNESSQTIQMEDSIKYNFFFFDN
jgi:hypothetical protein